MAMEIDPCPCTSLVSFSEALNVIPVFQKWANSIGDLLPLERMHLLWIVS